METGAFTSDYDAVRDRVRRLYPRSSAQDVVQQACCEALEYSLAGRQVDNPGALLWRIAMRKAIRPGYRSRGPPGTNYDPGSLTTREVDPWQVAVVAERSRRLHEAIARLSPAYLEVVRRFYFENESCGEIAMKLGVRRNVVKSRLHRVRKQLSWMLATEDPE